MSRLSRRAAIAAAVGAAICQLTLRTIAAPRGDDPAPPLRLVETGLYAAEASGTLARGVRSFSPQYPLWSDGAAKRRWVFLPEGTTIDVSDADAWRFPVGTKFWKEFSFGGRRVETRMLWKATDAEWVAATYVWNTDGTDAALSPDAGVAAAAELAPGRTHSIPSRADCATCHGAAKAPLGFNGLQLSTDRDPKAIHGEPLSPGMVTLRTLVDERLVTPTRDDFVARPPRIAADPRTRSVLGYLSANCGSCHDGSDQMAAVVPSLRYRDVMRDGGAVVRALVGRQSRWQAPGVPDGATMLVDPGSPDTSAILLRMSSRRPSSQMPPLGTVLRDQNGIDAVREWIEQLPRVPDGRTPSR